MASATACTVNPAARETSAVATAGEVFADATIVDLVRGNPDALSLVVSAKGRRPKVLSEVEHQGRVYVPATLDADYLKLMQFPARPGNPGDVGKLFNEIAEIVQKLTGIDLQFVQCAVYFAVATWFSDVFAEPPILIITGPRQLARAVLLVLSYFCRRSLLLQISRAADLGSVPLDFSPTLLLDASTLPATAIRRLLVPSASKFGIPKRAGVVQFCGAKAIYTGMVAPPMRQGGVRLPLSPAIRVSFASAGTPQEIADRFQSRLLGYRLTNYFAVQGSSFDVPAFSDEARTLARNLGACIVGDPALRDGVVPLFQAYSGAERDEQASDPLAYVIEGLLVSCHQGKPQVYVGKLAEKVNAILQGRGEDIEMSDREVGGKLKILGLATNKLDRAGRGLVLDRATRDRVHRLAYEYGVRMLDEAASRFPCCSEVQKNRPSSDIKPKRA